MNFKFGFVPYAPESHSPCSRFLSFLNSSPRPPLMSGGDRVEPRAWICKKVSESFLLDPAQIDGVIASSGFAARFDAFFKEGKIKRVIFYMTEDKRLTLTMDAIGESIVPVVKGQGKCCFFFRLSSRQITFANVDQELLFGQMESHFLDSFVEHLKFIFIPALESQESWGQSSRAEMVADFLHGVKKFTKTMEATVRSLHEVIKLDAPEPKFVVADEPQAILEASQNPELVKYYENLIGARWCRTVEQVLVESDQVRSEQDDVGPDAELDHWKERMARFSMITDQLRLPAYKAGIMVLHQAHSKVYRAWYKFDARITDASNEAKDNVKYLYNLDRFSQPLYQANPVEMLDAVPGMIKAIRQMHSLARYYNTSERMTALFVKVTNQMIVCCKNYILLGAPLWEQDRNSLIAKLHSCIDLRDTYREQYRRTKAELQAIPQGKQFDFSEVSIFGNFDMFCKRVQKLEDVVQTIEQFSTLKKTTLERCLDLSFPGPVATCFLLIHHLCSWSGTQKRE
ncbi:putative Dynein heavy chain 5; axonemal [Paratrimastix pyriformis]|uniref:Dynein heavy chain 5 n=1 Tax=Paratrimastix pyriformis TaxID=342808 RepID=A0ABQ8UM14_9EUKA|nr:putative Dynein heavy chain 5; axonemal [Paratrimastix pyriformis]